MFIFEKPYPLSTSHHIHRPIIIIVIPEPPTSFYQTKIINHHTVIDYNNHKYYYVYGLMMIIITSKVKIIRMRIFWVITLFLVSFFLYIIIRVGADLNHDYIYQTTKKFNTKIGFEKQTNLKLNSKLKII